MTIDAVLARAFGDRVGRRVDLAPFTTFRIGGPADWLLDTVDAGDIVTAVRIARSFGVPLVMLGGGSNVLVSDRGVRGLVVRRRAGEATLEPAGHVRADASMSVNGLVRWTVSRGLAGLESWAGTPGTVGGAMFGNAHFRGSLIGDLVESVRVVTREGEIDDLAGEALGFAYDRSRFQTSGEIVLSVVFRVAPGAPAALREAAKTSLAFRKQTQPLNLPSAGCIFRNGLAGDVGWHEGLPRSAGALLDQAGLKGARVGGAAVSPVHANFIVNEGGATAADVKALIDRCRDEVARRFGVVLQEEIVYLGEW